MTIDMTVYGKRFEAAKNIREKTNVTGQRLLTLVREPERIIARLQGAKPIYFDAKEFGRLIKLQFGLSNAGSGGGHVAVRSVRLSVE